ncbi:MAG: DUF3703 domain-containing protein [Bacteroidota bacterium]
MKFYTSIPNALKPYYLEELIRYESHLNNGELNNAWSHLERAHIIGQRYPGTHCNVHWKMFLFGIKIKNTREIIGQIPRLFFGGIKSFVGTVPLGNPGGANVSALKAYPIEKDIEEIFKKSGIVI